MSGHQDAELNDPRVLSTARLAEIVGDCLKRWDGYPTIPGGMRWRRNGLIALAELEHRAASPLPVTDTPEEQPVSDECPQHGFHKAGYVCPECAAPEEQR